MQEYKYIIIGGGMAGGSALKAIRKVDEEGSLALVSQENHRPYERPPLSKGYLRGETDRQKVYLQSADYYAEQKVDLFLDLRATGLDPENQTVTLEDGRSLGYGRLLLATGGRSRRLNLPGSDLPNVFTLRSIEDSEHIREAGGEGKQALVMGGSFIGCEVAASLAQLGTKVTMIFPESRLLERIVPEELSQYVQKIYEEHDVHILPGVTAKRLGGLDSMAQAVLDDGQVLDVDLVVMGVGIALNTELGSEAGLEMRENDHAILVDENLRTSDPHIYAAGDIAAWPDATFGQRLRVEHWDVARRQGLCAGRNMAGDVEAYRALPYFFSDQFDLSFEAWGDLSNWDRNLFRGSFEAGSFAYYYFDQDELTGVLAVDRPDAERLPMQELVKARLAYEEVADHLRDEDVDLAKLVEEKLETEKEGEEQMTDLSFAEDIQPMFRQKDVDEMIDIADFDLSKYEDVKEQAESIYARLADGSMPCDGAWPDEQLDKFKQWMDQGMEA